ncbi:MAG: DUF1415 domain-containing protein [Thiohalocapsa sp.]
MPAPLTNAPDRKQPPRPNSAPEPQLDPRPRPDPETAVRSWLDDVVIGLGLCPFAAPPWRRNAVRLVVSETADESHLLAQLHDELLRLDAADPTELETTLVILSGLFGAFEDFNQFLDPVDALLHRCGWSGEFQVASFHPDYRFADTEADDPGNLTNRSPYPILHLIREESIAHAVRYYPDPEDIPTRNMARLHLLDDADTARLFPYLLTHQ